MVAAAAFRPSTVSVYVPSVVTAVKSIGYTDG